MRTIDLLRQRAKDVAFQHGHELGRFKDRGGWSEASCKLCGATAVAHHPDQQAPRGWANGKAMTTFCTGQEVE